MWETSSEKIFKHKMLWVKSKKRRLLFFLYIFSFHFRKIVLIYIVITDTVKGEH